MKLTNSISLCIVFDDRVADTCVACNQGSSCGNSFFISGGHCHGQNFMVFLQIVAKSLIKKLPERHGSNNVEHRQTLAAFFVISGSFYSYLSFFILSTTLFGTSYFDDLTSLEKVSDHGRRLSMSSWLVFPSCVRT